MTAFISSHWVQIVAVATSMWTALNIAFNRIANSLPAPTAQDSSRYVFWFKFINNLALNTERARNNARIEDSPNFVAAAENYMRQKLIGYPTPPAGLSGPHGPQGVPDDPSATKP
jgi:hypothetical protein